MSASLAPECNEVKERYDTCFLKWYKYLRGQEKDNKECAGLFKDYQTCLHSALKARGIDKLLDDAREDNKDNDVKHMGNKIFAPTQNLATADLVPPASTSRLPHLGASTLRSMHPFSVLTLAIFVAGYITARWDLVTRIYELAIFAWENGVVARAAQAFAGLTLLFLAIFTPTVLISRKETHLPRNAEFHLRSGTFFRSEPHPPNRIYEICGHSSMHVLGLSNPPDPSAADPSWFCATTGPNQRTPRITCAKAASVQLILYDRPRPQGMQYISLYPISLALGHDGSSRGGAKPPEADEEFHEKQLKEERRKLVEKLKQHSIFKRVPSARDKALPKIVNQVNWSWELEQTLQKNVGRIGTRPRRSLSVSERVVESATTMRNYVILQLWTWFTVYLFPVLRQAFILLLMGHRMMAEMLLFFLEFRVKPGYAALKDISATAQQIEIRLQQFCYWPMQYLTLRQRKGNWASVTTSHPDYIRFYNSLWLVANDVIIGIALGSYIIENADWVADQISNLLRTYTVEALQSSISWLMGWPAGLKLNGELAAFLGDLFLWVIDYWSSCIETLTPALPQMVWFIGFSSFAGASMPIAMFSDMLSALTIHIYSFYLASGRIYHWQLTILQSLFHLFRGKKHNILRNRIDSCDYDLDQLLVGTILFTLLFFLLPTVAVFYLNFAIARMVIISLKAGFDTLLSCLNHFPLFALMLKIKDPRRLPVIYLKSIPLTFRAMFNQYFQMANRIRKHYLSPRVFFCLLTGIKESNNMGDVEGVK
ncbi:hypothetical protein G7Z17_g5880 [Cylindrodendrum hubeiense]|uniref:Uncharacterized protein n=1 Tax=Cylindrodendrum hubeiense TaxID=595255 RepID=A0A9P5HG86_9HYPO|nr:hypothetical protein G7Z17_g5880 [Cylindrodendrum hubeiense]